MTDALLDRFPMYAAAVKARQAAGPTIWLVTGDLFADRSLATLTDGSAQVAMLNRAGVDAVVMTPDWLSFGLPRLDEMVSRSRFYVLSASLRDGAGQALGHPFMVRNSGSAVLALAGLALDSSNVLTRMAGVRYAAPDFAARKAVALMRQRADLVGVLVEPRTFRVAGDADFTVNVGESKRFVMAPSEDTARMNWYGVSADAAHLTAGTVDLGRLRPDTAVALLLDSIRTAAESAAARNAPLPSGPWTAERLSGLLVRCLFASKLADGFACDSLLVSDFREPTDVGTFVDILRDPGRLAMLTVQGDVLSGWPEDLVLRPGLSRTRLSRQLTYRVATTVDYLQRNPRLAASGFELSARPFWTICLDILESGQVK